MREICGNWQMKGLYCCERYFDFFVIYIFFHRNIPFASLFYAAASYPLPFVEGNHYCGQSDNASILSFALVEREEWLRVVVSF